MRGVQLSTYPLVCLLAIGTACSSGIPHKDHDSAVDDLGDREGTGGSSGTAGSGGAVGGSSGTAGSGGAAGARGTDASVVDPPRGGAGGTGGALDAGSAPDRTGSAGSAGPPDARAVPATDAGNPLASGASRCAAAGVQFCEDFENGLSSTSWQTSKSGGTVAVDDVHAARGSKALHVTSTNGGMNAVRTTKGFPATDNTLYARMFVWFEDEITTGGHFTLAQGAGTGTPGLMRFGGISKRLGVGSDGGPSGDWTTTDSKSGLPTKRWICYEFQFDGAMNMFRVWVDDVESLPLHTGVDRHPTLKMPIFNSLWFGWVLYGGGESQELWIDEIAIDANKIGCAK